MKIFRLKDFKEYSVFFWLTLLTILGVVIIIIYSNNQEEQTNQIKSSLDNIYLKKTVKEITENLKPRYETVYYKSKVGDSFEGIISNLNLNKTEKKLLLKTILNEKSCKF